MFKKIFVSPKTGIFDIISAVFFLLSLVVIFLAGADISSLNTEDKAIEIGYLAAGTDGNNFYFIDSGKSRVAGIKDNAVEFLRQSGSSKSDFYQAEDLCIDPSDNSFYVLTVDWDGSGYLLASERILHYDSTGSYIDKAYEVSYKPQDEINKHRIFDIRFTDGKLSFVRADDKNVSLCVIEKGRIISEESYDYPDAWVYFQNFAHTPDGAIYGVEKRGHIIKFADNSQSVVYSSPKDSKEVLYDIDISDKGQIYFVDIYGGRICRVLSDKTAFTVLLSQSLYGKSTDGKGVSISNVYAGGDILFTIYNDEAVGFDAGGNVKFRQNSFALGKRQLIIFGIYTAIFTLSLICLIYLMIRAACYFIYCKPKFSRVTILEIGLIIFTLVLSSSIIYGVSNPFQYNYLEHISGQLKDMAIIGANRFNEDWLEGIHNASDFMNEDYSGISDLLYSITTANHDVDSRYGAEIDIIDPDGRAYALCYTDLSIGTYYPLDPSTQADVQKIYETGDSSSSKPTLSAGGTFLFGRSPIFSREGKVIGVLAVAQDNYRVMELFNRIITNIIVGVMLSIVAMIFFMNEGFAIIPEMREEKRLGINFARIGDKPASLAMLRILAFAIVFVLNMTSSFLPVYTSGFWNETLGIPESMAGALPLFANALFISLSALFCPFLNRKIGFRFLTAIGIICCSSGDLLAGLSRNYISILLALLLNGMGFGILTNTIYLTIGMIEPQDKQQKSLVGNAVGTSAGINIGTIVGSFLASSLPYHQVFFVTSTLWVLLIFLFWHAGKQIKQPAVVKADAEQSSSDEVRKKFIPFKGIILLLILFMPYAFIEGFQYFYIPILIDNLGYNPTYTSALLVIRAIFVIALSSAMVEIVWGKLKNKGAIAAYLTALSAWMLIAGTTDLRVVIVSIIFLGISFSFGNTVLIQTFLESDYVKNIENDTALVLCNFFIGLGNALSSIVFGIILGSGLMFGMSIFSAICLVLLLLSFILLRKK
ncbi:MAG: MFS transporter [Synergistaceae bacterium]|nr:MFS transporter [Synergistaceae bacterium]